LFCVQQKKETHTDLEQREDEQIMNISEVVFFAFLSGEHMKSSDANTSKCHLKFSSRMIIFIKLVYLSSVI